MLADIINEKIFKAIPFSWGEGDKSANRDPRSEYLKAVKAADYADFTPLLEFARS